MASQPGRKRIAIDDVLKWAKTQNISDAKAAKERYSKLIDTEKLFFKKFPEKTTKQGAKTQQQMGQTYTKPTNCKLYEVIELAMKKTVSSSSNAISEYHSLKSTEQLYHETLQQPTPGKAKQVSTIVVDGNVSGTRASQAPSKIDAKSLANTVHGIPVTSGQKQRESDSKVPSKIDAKSLSNTVHGIPATSGQQQKESNSKATSKIEKQSLTNTLHGITVTSGRQQRERDFSPSKATGNKITISKENYDRLHNTVEIQAAKIKELELRLSSFASKQLTDGNPNIADLSDKNRPSKIGEQFAELYDNEWSDAYEALRPVCKTDDETVSLLSKIVGAVYIFCQEMTESQLRRISEQMEYAVTNLKIYRTGEDLRAERYPEDPTIFAPTRRLAREYRKETALASVPALCVLFCDVEFREKFPNLSLPEISENVTLFINKCVELIWLMCIQNPTMVLEWQNPGTDINNEVFKFYSKKGKIVKLTVWPAVFLHQGGPLVSKGHVLPS